MKYSIGTLFKSIYNFPRFGIIIGYDRIYGYNVGERYCYITYLFSEKIYKRRREEEFIAIYEVLS